MTDKYTPDDLAALRKARAAKPFSRIDGFAKVVELPNPNRNEWKDRITRSEKGTPHATHANVITILQHDERWVGVLGFDEFASQVEIRDWPPWHGDDAAWDTRPGAWTDQDAVRLSSWLARNWQLRCGLDVCHGAADVVSRARPHHPVKDYLDRLKWDGQPRVREWLSTYAGATACDYTREVSTIVLVSACARVYKPGCKVDTIAVLEGQQGRGKSTLIRALAGDAWFSDTPLDLSSKDRFVALRSVWIYELSELDGFGRTEQERIKNFFSSQVDDYRPPYGRASIRVPRQVCFIGTTNAHAYLRDTTGNRRFLPVRTNAIDVEGIRRDRDQLWAEARELYRGGAQWWPSANLAEVYSAEQEKRVQVDAWDDEIAAYVVGKDKVKLSDVLKCALNVEPGRHTQADQNRVAKALQRLGWERKQMRIGKSPDGKQLLGWFYVPSSKEVVT